MPWPAHDLRHVEVVRPCLDGQAIVTCNSAIEVHHRQNFTSQSLIESAKSKCCLLTSLDLAVGDLHIPAACDVDAVGVGTGAGRRDRQACQLHAGAILDGHVHLLAVDDLQVLHPQARAVVERQRRRRLLARLHECKSTLSFTPLRTVNKA